MEMITQAGLDPRSKIKDMIIDGQWNWPREWNNSLSHKLPNSVPSLNDGTKDMMYYEELLNRYNKFIPTRWPYTLDSSNMSVMCPSLVILALGGILTCYGYTVYVFVYIHKEGFLVVKGRMNLVWQGKLEGIEIHERWGFLVLPMLC
ncbi:hypothetical protein Tco_1179170 [Tanacetum coccineum]